VAERAKILLVDDRPENLIALEAVLGALDQTLVRAGSGEEALKALLTEDFAVILLDVQMPGLDGFETAAHIKRRDRTKDIPIIFLTAVSNGPHHTFRGYAAGAVDYLSKPFDPWVLRAKVSVFVDLYRKNQLIKEQAALLADRLGGAAAAKEPASGASGGAGSASASGAGAAGRERGSSAEAPSGAASGAELVAELSARLAAVEEHVRALEKLAGDAQRPTIARDELAAASDVLAARVGRLRSAIDALS
jgi:CheY-like chemotaxis protein